MRILLAEHYVQPREALKTVLAEQDDLRIVGEAVNARELLQLAEQRIADLVLVDIELPGLDIERVIKRLCELNPRPIVVTMGNRSEDSARILNVGANAYISKVEQSDWLLDTLNKYGNQIKIKEEEYQGI